MILAVFDVIFLCFLACSPVAGQLKYQFMTDTECRAHCYAAGVLVHDDSVRTIMLMIANLPFSRYSVRGQRSASSSLRNRIPGVPHWALSLKDAAALAKTAFAFSVVWRRIVLSDIIPLLEAIVRGQQLRSVFSFIDSWHVRQCLAPTLRAAGITNGLAAAAAQAFGSQLMTSRYNDESCVLESIYCDIRTKRVGKSVTQAIDRGRDLHTLMSCADRYTMPLWEDRIVTRNLLEAPELTVRIIESFQELVDGASGWHTTLINECSAGIQMAIRRVGYMLGREHAESAPLTALFAANEEASRAQELRRRVIRSRLAPSATLIDPAMQCVVDVPLIGRQAPIFGAITVVSLLRRAHTLVTIHGTELPTALFVWPLTSYTLARSWICKPSAVVHAFTAASEARMSIIAHAAFVQTFNAVIRPSASATSWQTNLPLVLTRHLSPSAADVIVRFDDISRAPFTDPLVPLATKLETLALLDTTWWHWFGERARELPAAAGGFKTDSVVQTRDPLGRQLMDALTHFTTTPKKTVCDLAIETTKMHNVSLDLVAERCNSTVASMKIVVPRANNAILCTVSLLFPIPDAPSAAWRLPTTMPHAFSLNWKQDVAESTCISAAQLALVHKSTPLDANQDANLVRQVEAIGDLRLAEHIYAPLWHRVLHGADTTSVTGERKRARLL